MTAMKPSQCTPSPFSLNADLGEGLDEIDNAIFPLLDQANIACGGHAGNEASMRRCITLAKQYEVVIGAHPSYPDTANFGRKSLNMSEEALLESLMQQVSALADIANSEGCQLTYLKPHGALYNDWAKPSRLKILLNVAKAFDTSLMLAAGQTEVSKACASEGVVYLKEGFADRGYNDDATLVARNLPGALLDQDQILERVASLAKGQGVVTISGKALNLAIDSLCLHSDTPGAVATAQAIRQQLNRLTANH